LVTLVNAYREISGKIDQRSYWLAQIQTLTTALQKERSARIEVEEQFHQLTGRAEALGRLSKRLNGQLEVQTVLATLCQISVETFHVPTAFVTRFDEQCHLLHPAYSFGLGAQELSNLTPTPISRFVDYPDLSEPIIFSRPEQDGRPFPYPEFLPGRRTLTLVCAAMVQEGSLFGIFHLVAFNPSRQFKAGELDLLQAFASYGTAFLSKARLFEQVRTGRNRLQHLSQQLLEVQEMERRHLARELHDEIGQTLTSLKTILELIPKEGGPQEHNDQLTQAGSLVQQLLCQVRELALDLRPALLDDLGLLPALHVQFERYTSQTNIEVNFAESGIDRRFSPEIETAAYRIVQEGLTNAARYAEVDRLTVRLRADGETFLVQIEDAGIGFDPQLALSSSATNGLSGMQERALLLGGYLVIESQLGKGTRLTAELPLTAPIERRLNDRIDPAV